MATCSTNEGSRDAALIINLGARSGSRASRAAVAELEQRRIRLKQTHYVRKGSQLKEATALALASGLTTIIVGGGDGSISTVAGLMAGRPGLVLGVLPIGTGNEVARELGIPLSLVDACAVVAGGKVKTFDLGETNGHYFLHTALVGHPAHVNHTMPSSLKAHFGKPAYIYALIASLISIRPFRARINAGDATWEGETGLVVIGNNQFHAPGRVLLPNCENEESGLLVYAARDGRRSTYLRLAVSLWITRQPETSLLFSQVADSVTLETDIPQDIDLDGEFSHHTPARFCLARQALRVLVPSTGGPH